MLSFARFISYLFHPLWMPVYIFFLAINVDPYLYAFFPRPLIGLFVVVLGINVLAPGLSMLFMWKRGLIADLELSNRKERAVPYVLVLMYYSISYFMLQKTDLPIPLPIYSMFIGVIVSLVIAVLINLVWKISVHAIGVGGLIGTFLALFHLHGYSIPLLLSGFILVASLVGFARVFLEKHTLNQVYAGSLLGILISYCSIYYTWVI